MLDVMFLLSTCQESLCQTHSVTSSVLFLLGFFCWLLISCIQPCFVLLLISPGRGFYSSALERERKSFHEQAIRSLLCSYSTAVMLRLLSNYIFVWKIIKANRISSFPPRCCLLCQIPSWQRRPLRCWMTKCPSQSWGSSWWQASPWACSSVREATELSWLLPPHRRSCRTPNRSGWATKIN